MKRAISAVENITEPRPKRRKLNTGRAVATTEEDTKSDLPPFILPQKPFLLHRSTSAPVITNANQLQQSLAQSTSSIRHSFFSSHQQIDPSKDSEAQLLRSGLVFSGNPALIPNANRKEYRCCDCNEKYSHPFALRKHRWFRHLDDAHNRVTPRWRCLLCNVSFRARPMPYVNDPNKSETDHATTTVGVSRSDRTPIYKVAHYCSHSESLIYSTLTDDKTMIPKQESNNSNCDAIKSESTMDNSDDSKLRRKSKSNNRRKTSKLEIDDSDNNDDSGDDNAISIKADPEMAPSPPLHSNQSMDPCVCLDESISVTPIQSYLGYRITPLDLKLVRFESRKDNCSVSQIVTWLKYELGRELTRSDYINAAQMFFGVKAYTVVCKLLERSQILSTALNEANGNYFDDLTETDLSMSQASIVDPNPPYLEWVEKELVSSAKLFINSQTS